MMACDLNISLTTSRPTRSEAKHRMVRAFLTAHRLMFSICAPCSMQSITKVIMTVGSYH